MKFPKSWVDSWVNSNLSAQELSDTITMAGLEVDTCEKVCADFNGVVVGEVLECVDHPDSDHMHVTKVNVGRDEPVQIVCGAANCRQGLKVACALIGANLPGLVIKAAKLRGVESCGMLCSYKELGMAEESDGIIELPADAPVGTDLHTYMQLDDYSVDVDLTSNRPDCLSIRGIAREVAVLTRNNFVEPEVKATESVIEDTFPIEIKDFAACPRYVGRVIKGVDRNAKTPVEMSERLRRCGIRSVSPVVDVTNYVMLELGQPLHSFDLNKLSGGIVVRFAEEGEKLVLLSGQEVELRTDTLVIADSTGPLALAGIFGGASSGVSDDTCDIFLESAFFSPLAIKGRARHYGLKTDASHRFERGVDYNLQRRAIERATELLVQIAGGKPGPVCECADPDFAKKEHTVDLRSDRLQALLGCKIDDSEVAAILCTLGLNPVAVEGGFRTTAPSFRFDIAIEEDLVEEIARIRGYNKLPKRLPVAEMVMGSDKEEVLKDSEIRKCLVHAGYQEAITYSFTDPKALKVFSDSDPMVLSAPISVEMSAMRTSMLAGLCLAAKYNLNRQQKRIRLFETGLTYIRDSEAENGVRQEPMIGGVVIGDVEAESWNQPSRRVDFFDIKGDVESLFSLTGRAGDVQWRPTEAAYLHPGQGADLYLDGQFAGCVGMLHPQAQKALGFKQAVAVFELKRSALASKLIPVSREISKFPSVRRDFAFVIAKDVSAADLTAEIRKAGGKLVTDVTVFDVFSNESLGDKVSVALGVTLHDNDHTLEESEVEGTVGRIVSDLASAFGATLRE